MTATGPTAATDSGPEVRRPARHSVLLIREWERQMSSSGCCGRLEGDFLAPRGERCFPERRRIMEAMGPLYRELRDRYGEDVDVQVIDPRNVISLVPLLVRDVRRHGVGLPGALRTLFALPATGVVADGRIVARGRWPDAREVAAAIGLEAPARTAAEAT